MKKTLLRVFALFISIWGNAQTVTYSVDNYTEELSPFKPSLTLLGLEAIKPQFGFTIEGAIGKRLGYNTAFRHDYFKNLFTPKSNLANPDDKRAGNYFEASVDFFLTNKIKEGSSPLRIVTSSSTYGNYSYTRYFTAYVDKRTQFGLHAGVYYFNRSVFTGTTEDPVLELTDIKTGIEAPNTTNYTVNTNNPALFAGLVFKKVRKATIHSDGWKYYRHMGRRIYMDALFGATSYKDVVANGNTYEVSAVKSSPIGYRLGFEWDQMGVVTGFELGYRPGVNYTAIPGFNYWNLNFSYNLFNGDKRYAMRNKR
jgi:hypothetical protein